MIRHTSILSAAIVLGLAACSGGSSSETPSGSPGTNPGNDSIQLVIDTAAGSDARVTGRLDAVAFERVDGSMVGNLLDEPASIVLADPDGQFSAVTLNGLETDVYSAVHLVFAPGSLSARFPDGGQQQVELATMNLRVGLRQIREFPRGDDRIAVIFNRRMTFGNRGNGSGVIPIDPILDGSTADVVPVRYLRIEVLSIDAANQQLVAELSTDGNPTADVLFADPSLLLRDDVQVSIDDFIAGLSVSSTIQVIDGELATDDQNGRTLTVYAAVDGGVEDPNGNGRKAEVSGCIAAVDSANESFTLGLFSVDKGAHNLPDPLPGSLTIDADGARIKWVPRLGRHPGHLPFSALNVGMSVEVEWHGPAMDAVVPAQKVNIRDENATPLRGLGGTVTTIDVPNDQLGVELDEPVAVGDTTYTAIRLELTADTLIVGGDSNDVVQPPIARFQVGDELYALAAYDSGDLFVATYVRISR